MEPTELNYIQMLNDTSSFSISINNNNISSSINR